MKTYKYDSEIADLVFRIMNTSLVVETINESILVKLFEMRGTPLKIKSTIRNIDADYKEFCKEEPEAPLSDDPDARDKRTRKMITPDTKQEIREAIIRGSDPAEIAEAYGVSIPYIFTIRQKLVNEGLIRPNMPEMSDE